MSVPNLLKNILQKLSVGYKTICKKYKNTRPCDWLINTTDLNKKYKIFDNIKRKKLILMEFQPK